MILQNIQNILETWAPKDIAWEQDNTGLQIGSPNQNVKNILITLDVNSEVVEEARKKKADLIISHHPLLYKPLKSVNFDQRNGNLVQKLILYKIALYSIHTNLDFTKDGVSFTLAEQIGLKDIDFLYKDKQTQKKITVFVPPEYTQRVSSAMADAGAGIIGNYESCAFETDGVGMYKPGIGSTPFKGKAGNLEHITETRLEMTAPSWKVNSVVSAMKAVHPYEEVAYDIYELSNFSNDYGAGAIGILPGRMNKNKFLKHIGHSLKLPVVKYSGTGNTKIERVAVCGGGGSDLLSAAIRQNADAFITGDISYHRFEEAEDKIIMIDAGHFETEHPIIHKIAVRLKNEFTKHSDDIKIFESKAPSNNIQYFIP
jgi:dinuclear metal center YbgI/SA1388 family protein